MFKKILAGFMAMTMAFVSLTISAGALPIVDSNEGEEEVIIYLLSPAFTSVTLPAETYTHTLGEITPKPTVKYKKDGLNGNYTTLTENVDYTVSYSDNIEVGTATVTIKGKGSFASSIKTTFEIVHNYSSAWTIDKAATCTHEGSKSHHCTVCGDKKDVTTIAKTAHKYTATVVNPTYTENGYTLYTCSSCGYSYKENYTDRVVTDNVTGLKLTSNTASSISMNWDKVDGATGYVVYQAINGKWQRIKVTSGNSLTVSKLKAGTNYRFTVKAYKTVDGTNYYSNSYSAVWMTTLPAKPNAKMTVNTAQAIRLEWDSVEGAAGYVVYKQVNGTWQRVTVTKSNVYVFTGLASGTNYNYAVRAYKNFGDQKYYSTFSTSTDTIKACTKPAAVNFKLTAGSKKATVSWNKVKGATGYIVYYKTSANGKWQRLTTTTGTSYTKTGLTSGKTYYFTVKAYKTYNGNTYNAGFSTKSVKVK